MTGRVLITYEHLDKVLASIDKEAKDLEAAGEDYNWSIAFGLRFAMSILVDELPTNTFPIGDNNPCIKYRIPLRRI